MSVSAQSVLGPCVIALVVFGCGDDGGDSPADLSEPDTNDTNVSTLRDGGRELDSSMDTQSHLGGMLAEDSGAEVLDAAVNVEPCLEDISIAQGATTSATCILQPGTLQLGRPLEVFGMANTGSFNSETILYQFTISFWTRAFDLSTEPDSNTIVSHSHFNDPMARPLVRDSFRIRWASENSLELATTNLNQTGLAISSVEGLDAFGWNHIVLVYDNGADCIKLYVNGVEETENCIGGLYGGLAAYILFGNVNIQAAGFSGLIDEVSTWTAGLPADAVTELYNDGIVTDALAHTNVDWLTGYWRMGEMASDGVVPDSSGNDHDAIVISDEGEVRFVSLE